MRRSLALLLGCLLLLASCRSQGRAQAEQAVRTYLDKMIEAYRRSDEALVDSLVGERHGLKLLGLIGVKRDAGVVLDAKLLDLQFTRVERKGDGWVVETKERWYYADRNMKTGRMVGQDSTDDYALRYVFVPKDGKLILEELEFIGQPRVGRTVLPIPTDPRVMHGLNGAEEPAAAAGAPRTATPAGHSELPAGAAGRPPPGHPPVQPRP